MAKEKYRVFDRYLKIETVKRMLRGEETARLVQAKEAKRCSFRRM